MPSPFPGMDPYIETSRLWGDFHGDLAAEIRASLNRQIRPRYSAQMVPQVTYEVIEISRERRVLPDVGVSRTPPAAGGVRETPALIAPAPAESLVQLEQPLRFYTVEIHEVETKNLVTAIEILSPVNKLKGHEAYTHYQRKRRELLRSEAHLMEIDLLRAGARPPLERPVPTAPYYVTLSRVPRHPRAFVWPIQLRDKLPLLPVPLSEPDPDATLDLGKMVASVYERGAYSDVIDYRQPPPPPLTDEEAAYVAQVQRAHGA